MTRIRIGFVMGLAVGYYFGAKAGRERYHQLNELMNRVGHSSPVDSAADKAKHVIDLGYEKAKDGIEDVVRHTHSDAGNGKPAGFGAS